jgi:glutamate-1-semialdehyde 2,1-aminomutase
VLRDRPDIYERLERQTERLVEGLNEIVDRRAVSCQIRGFGSIFTMSFRDRPPRYYRERFSGSDIRANIALAYFMRAAGVYMAELHTYFIGAAHSDEDLEHVLEAFDLSVSRMQDAGILS